MSRIHRLLLFVNLALIIGFGARFILALNYEFIIYVGIIILAMVLIGISLKRVRYTHATLISLTVWSGMHLAGGAIPIGEGRLYDVILVPLSDTLPILRYDQLVHIWGFGACTLLAHSLLRNHLQKPERGSLALGLVLVMAGLGLGALNEIAEFLVNAIVPESGVGGYLNTSLDLCADLIGACFGLIYIGLFHWSHPTPEK